MDPQYNSTLSAKQLLERKAQREQELAVAQQQLVAWQVRVNQSQGAIAELNDQIKQLEQVNEYTPAGTN